MAFPKSIKIPWKKKRIAAKGRFVVKDNPLKSCRQRYPNEKLRQWVEQRRAEQLDENGLPKWPGEKAFKRILDNLKIYDQHQAIYYRTGSFILIDFLIPVRKVAFELDGVSHTHQMDCDIGRDRWLLETHGIRTVRVSNATALRNPRATEAIVRAELGLR